MNTKPDDTVIYKCIKCGDEAEGEVHTLPKGWEMTTDNEICDKCLADVATSLKLHEVGRHIEARTIWNRRLKAKPQ